MATPQLSPGVLIREVDQTVGRSENVLDNIGAIAGPFAIGPVDEAITIETEQQLINTYGKPMSTDRQYEYWMSASSFLSYGGILKVVRTGGGSLNNSNAAVGMANTTTLKIDNYDDYEENHLNDNSFVYASKNPGSWANNLKVCTIDNAADQRIGIGTTSPLLAGAIVGHGVTSALSNIVIPGAGTTTTFTGYLKGIITGVSTDTVNGNSTIDVKIVSQVSSAGTETKLDYQQSNSARSFEAADGITFVNNVGVNTGNGTVTAAASAVDWYDQQTLDLTNSVVFWKSLAPKPVDNNFSSSRSGNNDAIHIAVVDDEGSVTGVQGNILEKFLSLSKAKDSTADGDSPTRTYYKDYVALNSNYIYAGYNVSQATDAYHGTSPKANGFSTGYTANTIGAGLWGQDAQGVNFSSIGNKSYSLGGGVDYQAGGGMAATLGGLNTSYNIFSNKDDIAVDYIMMGPSLLVESESQAKANLIISLAEGRKDCMAVVSPHRDNVVSVNNSTTQTDNLLRYYSALSSSSYAVFDSGYKYTYDRFNNEFRYIPCNPDIAGLMVRTSIESFPWFSPAGSTRGVLNNAIKLAYNPSKGQRDVLYGARVNSIINQRGSGVLLFGDKTALSYSSAFDRINVRRLFLTVEQALEGAANAQLFQLNDSITRSNFVNIVEPYLRDVEAKRGLYGFVVVCDDTNNTPDIIDNNEFRADIFLKPTKSINYITLTFVATRTGVAFEEIVGTV
jgi:hypothetical protein